MAFKNLQFLLGNSKMEEDLLPTDETNDGVEVTADIAVKVAEDNDASDALTEDLDTVDNDVTEQEEILDDVETLQYIAANIRKFGTNPASFDIINMKNRLNRIIKEVPALESLSAVGRNEAESRALISGIESVVNSFYEKANSVADDIITKADCANKKTLALIPRMKNRISLAKKMLSDSNPDPKKLETTIVTNYGYGKMVNTVNAINTLLKNSDRIHTAVGVKDNGTITVVPCTESFGSNALATLGLGIEENRIVNAEKVKRNKIKLSAIDKQKLIQLADQITVACESFKTVEENLSTFKNSMKTKLFKENDPQSKAKQNLYFTNKMKSLYSYLRVVNKAERQLCKLCNNYVTLCSAYAKVK